MCFNLHKRFGTILILACFTNMAYVLDVSAGEVISPTMKSWNVKTFRLRLPCGVIQFHKDEWPLILKDGYRGKLKNGYFQLSTNREYVVNQTENSLTIVANDKYGQLRRKLTFTGPNTCFFSFSFKPGAKFADVEEFAWDLVLNPNFFYGNQDIGLNVEFHETDEIQKQFLPPFWDMKDHKGNYYGASEWNKAIFSWNEDDQVKNVEIIPDFGEIPVKTMFHDRRNCCDRCYRLSFLFDLKNQKPDVIEGAIKLSFNNANAQKCIGPEKKKTILQNNLRERNK